MDGKDNIFDKHIKGLFLQYFTYNQLLNSLALSSHSVLHLEIQTEQYSL